MNMQEPKPFHYTCTKTTGLSPDPERIPQETVDKLVEKYMGVEPSKDPVTARIQREQALVKYKRDPSNKLQFKID